jgi:hypothetical protein
LVQRAANDPRAPPSLPLQADYISKKEAEWRAAEAQLLLQEAEADDAEGEEGPAMSPDG